MGRGSRLGARKSLSEPGPARKSLSEPGPARKSLSETLKSPELQTRFHEPIAERAVVEGVVDGPTAVRTVEDQVDQHGPDPEHHQAPTLPSFHFLVFSENFSLLSDSVFPLLPFLVSFTR